MTDPTLARVRETAAAYAQAVRETQRYLDRIADTGDPAVLAEYANLAAREESAQSERRDALTEAGLEIDSIDGTD